MNLANRIRELREEVHMTQIRLSTELEVSQETVSAYENGRHYPSFAALVRMSHIFHASIDYIMGLSDLRKPFTAQQLTNQQQTLLELFDSLDNLNQARALAYLQGLYDCSRQTKQPSPK